MRLVTAAAPQGFTGYPNLNDDDWLWGGTLDDLHHTISFGIRSTHDDTRVNDMPAFLRDEILSREEVGDVVDYVLSLNGQGEDRRRPSAARFCSRITALPVTVRVVKESRNSARPI